MTMAVRRIEIGQDIMVRIGLATKLDQHRREESTEVLLFNIPKVMEKHSKRSKSTFPHIFDIIDDCGTCQVISSQGEIFEGKRTKEHSYRIQLREGKDINICDRVNTSGNIRLPYIQRSELGPDAFHSENVLP